MSKLAAWLAPCGIRHVPVDAPPKAIEPIEGERGLYVLFWCHGRPAGLRVLVREELPVPAAAVQALAADAVGAASAAADSGASDRSPDGAPAVSLVICTRDRPDDLRRCLAAALACDPAPSEIIVVDNAPKDDGSARVALSFRQVRYLREERPGLSRARNAGVRAAWSEIVAFTDDDVEVSSDWIGRIAGPFSDPEVACVTGIVIPADLSTAAACLFEFEIGGLGRGLVPRRFDAGYLQQGRWRSPAVWRIGAGANMAVRRQAFLEVGLFDTRLGAGASGCSEDSELWFRILRAGKVCRYDPSAVVFHHHRTSLGALKRQLRAYIRGHVVALFIEFSQDRRACHLARAFGVLPGSFLKLALRAWLRRDRHALALIGAQVIGLLEGPLYALRWRSRKRAQLEAEGPTS